MDPHISMSIIDSIKGAIARRLFSCSYLPDSLTLWSITGIYDTLGTSIQSYHQKRLRHILQHAVDTTTYWHRVLPATGINVRTITLEQFQRIPILDRETLKHNPDEILANNLRKRSVTTITTSGSSGVPLKIYADDVFLKKRILIHRHYLQKVLHLNGTNNFANLRNRTHTMILGHHVNLLTDDLASEVSWLADNVQAACGPLFNLMNFARRLNKLNIKLNLDFVVSCAEFLSPTDRKYMEKTFNCLVYDQYSNVEVGLMAFECPLRNGFHVNTANIFLEIVDKRGMPVQNGEIGRILVTAFDNRAMPLIRYDTADLGQWMEGVCPCNLKTPRLIFEGRSSNVLKLPHGREYYLKHLMSPLDIKFGEIIEKFQFLQKSRELLILRIIPSAKYKNGDEVAIRKTLIGRMVRARAIDDGGAFDIRIEKVGAIENFPSGKARLFVSAL